MEEKAFGIHGANALAKVCVLSEKFQLEELEEPIPMDTSVEDWINNYPRAMFNYKSTNKVLEELCA